MATKRRGHGAGSVWQTDDGRWRAQVSLGDGKRKSSPRFKTQKEANDWEARTRADLTRGALIAEGPQTVKAYLADWLETKRREGLEPGTLTSYEAHIRLRVVPVIGKHRLDKLTPQHVQQMLNRAAEHVGPTTVHHSYRVLHTALADAFRQGAVIRNVCDLIRAPRKRHHEMLVWTPEQAYRFRAAVRGDRYEALYTLALATGMRQGELFGLRWSDVDLSLGTVQVERNMQRELRTDPAPDEPLTAMRSKQPKTGRGRRRIQIEAGVIEALRAHRTRQLSEQMAVRNRWRAHDLVFCSRFGGPLNKSNIDPQHRAHCLAAGVPVIRFHDMRHTAATLMLLSGVPLHVVSEILGHSSPMITSTLYAHVLQSQRREAAGFMDAILHGVSPATAIRNAD